eukprot:765979-Hanusia_phi.AAC.2
MACRISSKSSSDTSASSPRLLSSLAVSWQARKRTALSRAQVRGIIRLRSTQASSPSLAYLSLEKEMKEATNCRNRSTAGSLLKTSMARSMDWVRARWKVSGSDDCACLSFMMHLRWTANDF